MTHRLQRRYTSSAGVSSGVASFAAYQRQIKEALAELRLRPILNEKEHLMALHGWEIETKPSVLGRKIERLRKANEKGGR